MHLRFILQEHLIDLVPLDHWQIQQDLRKLLVSLKVVVECLKVVQASVRLVAWVADHHMLTIDDAAAFFALTKGVAALDQGIANNFRICGSIALECWRCHTKVDSLLALG